MTKYKCVKVEVPLFSVKAKWRTEIEIGSKHLSNHFCLIIMHRTENGEKIDVVSPFYSICSAFVGTVNVAFDNRSKQIYFCLFF